MQVEARREHEWLQRFVGEWTMEAESVMGPGQPPSKSRGVEVVRSLGGLWTVGEGEGEGPDGTMVRSVMTLGFDPRTGRFVGSFIASIMTHLWIYDGALDAAGEVLTMDVEGPDFSGQKLARYQDIFEVVDDDHRTLRSQVLGDDGNWIPFMTARYTRRAPVA